MNKGVVMNYFLVLPCIFLAMVGQKLFCILKLIFFSYTPKIFLENKDKIFQYDTIVFPSELNPWSLNSKNKAKSRTLPDQKG